MFSKPTLIIDASGDNVKLAFVENNQLAKELTTTAPALETVSQAMSEICSDFSKIENYAICTGPGSMLGERFASVFASTLAKLYNAKIFEWDSMKVASFAIASIPATPDKFSLFTPSRKGFANIVNFANGDIIEQKEIEISEIDNSAEDKKYILKQRKILPKELSEFEEVQPSPAQIFETLQQHCELLSSCDMPPDAKSLTKREYVKWKAQAHI